MEKEVKMNKNIAIIKRSAYVLGILLLLLGLLPIPFVSRVGSAFAQEEEPTPEVVVEEPLVEEPVVEEPEVEEPLFQELVFTEELMTSAATEGPDPLAEKGSTRAKLPKAPGNETNYNNGLCNSDANKDICDDVEPVTKPNPGGQDFESSANIVVFKVKNEYFFFEKGEGRTCDENAKFCVEFWKDGDKDMVTVYSYWQDKSVKECTGQGKDKVCVDVMTYHGPNLINFWKIDENMIFGCTDPYAANYNDKATRDDGSCYSDNDILGCMNPLANNYNPEATKDNGSCMYDLLGCTDPDANNYVEEATKDDGSCTYHVLGCTDLNANNYDEKATKDDGSCTYDGGEQPGGGSTGDGGGIASGGSVVSLPIPVIAQVSESEAAVLIPVTGVDLGAGAWQQLVRSLGLFFFGAAILLEGLQRKNRK